MKKTSPAIPGGASTMRPPYCAVWRARFIPILLLQGRGLVKTKRFTDARYVGDPMNAVRIFSEKAVDELTLLDIGASVERRGPDFDLLAEISSEAFVPLSYGGGVTKLEEFERLFRIGVEKVCVTTALAESWDLVRTAARVFGSQSVVAGIDVRKSMLGGYQRVVLSGRTKLRGTPVDAAKAAEAAGAGELLLTSVDRDGMRSGYDLDLVSQISAAVQNPCRRVGRREQPDRHGRSDSARRGDSRSAAGSIFVFQGKHDASADHVPR